MYGPQWARLSQAGGCRLGRGTNVDGFEVQLESVTLDARQVEHVADQAIEPA